MIFKPKVLLFDIGNVVVEADHAITHKILEEYGVARANAETFYSNNEYLEFSRGNLDHHAFYQILIDKYLKFHLDYKQVVNAHNLHIYKVNQDVERILQKLSSYQIAFATDTNQWQTERVRELIDLSNYSDRIFESHKIHMLKSDEGIFQYIAKSLNVGVERILLVDDSPHKIKAAKHSGLQTLLFKNATQLSLELRRQQFQL